MNSWAPLAAAILGNVLYHTTQKLTPANANPFLSLMLSFGSASLGCGLLYLATSGRALRSDLSALSWTTVGLGLSVIVIETGFMLSYRAGWRIGLTALVSTTSLTLLLLPVGRIFFGERLTLTGVVGVIVSLAGLGLITLQAAPH